MRNVVAQSIFRENRIRNRSVKGEEKKTHSHTCSIEELITRSYHKNGQNNIDFYTAMIHVTIIITVFLVRMKEKRLQHSQFTHIIESLLNFLFCQFYHSQVSFQCLQCVAFLFRWVHAYIVYMHHNKNYCTFLPFMCANVIFKFNQRNV